MFNKIFALNLIQRRFFLFLCPSWLQKVVFFIFPSLDSLDFTLETWNVKWKDRHLFQKLTRLSGLHLKCWCGVFLLCWSSFKDYPLLKSFFTGHSLYCPPNQFLWLKSPYLYYVCLSYLNNCMIVQSIFFLYPFPWSHTNNILLADSFESPLSCSLPMLTYENQNCIIIFPIEATWNESQIHIWLCLRAFIASVPGIDLRRKNNYSWFSAYIWHIL